MNSERLSSLSLGAVSQLTNQCSGLTEAAGAEFKVLAAADLCR
jgi:hypothetical protein